MIWPVVLAMIAVMEPPATSDAAADPPRNYLRGAESRACDTSGKADEIVVCGNNDPDHDRLKPIDETRYAERPVRAEVKVPGNGTLGLHVDPGQAGGVDSKRIMVTLSFPF